MSPLLIGGVILGGYLLLSSPKLRPSAPAIKTPSQPRSFWGWIDPTVRGSVGNKIIGEVGKALPDIFTSLGGSASEKPITSSSSLPIGGAQEADTTGIFV